MTPPEVRSEYDGLVRLFDDFVNEIINQVRHLVRERNIKLAFPVDGRTKQLDSVLGKIAAGKFAPKKSITEMQDLAGLRFVTLYKTEIPEIVRIIETLFPDPKRYNTKDRFGNDQFGYSSLHFIVSPPDAWKGVAHLSRFMGLRAEIQVRTLSEHIWAECSHSLNYKSSLNVPPGIERPLHRLSALMEIVDSELDYIKKAHQDYKETVERLDIEELLKEDLNILTLEKLLKVILANYKPVSEDRYATLDKLIEKDFSIKNLPFLLEIINKYLPQVPHDSELDHAQVLNSILFHYKENNYS
jgi:ppGpp synthetase/RelA/SpoT-type nucleotidyltranferase